MPDELLLFVYGTLKSGQRNHHLLRGRKLVQPAITEPLYRLFDQGTYPCLVVRDPGVAIEGEVYEVDEATLARIDELEGAPRLYQRGLVLLQVFPPSTIAYFYQLDVSEFPDCGPSWSE